MEQENPVVSQEVETESYPPLVQRFKSLIIDQVFIIVCMVTFSNLLPNTTGHNSDILRGVLLVAIFLMYEPFCMALFGFTVGNLLSGIRVRKFTDHTKRINIIAAYIRFMVKISLGIISFFTVTSSHSRRAIHDMASGSIMLYASKSEGRT